MTFKKIWSNLFYLNNLNNERRGRELILLIILTGSIICFTILNIIRINDIINNPRDRGLPLISTLIILFFFIFLFWLARKSYLKTASYFLLITYSIPTIYCFINWGTDLPAALLLSILIITLSGILLGENLVLISTILLISFLLITTYLQNSGAIKIINYWRFEKNELPDVISYSFILFIIALIVWLFCREIKKALIRAHSSELDLKKERDSLEVKVIERTNQIKLMEMEKINQLYRLAEFGRLSSGIFHDLVNPLTAVSLNLEQVKIEEKQELLSAKSYLNQAILATRKMENLIISIKKQIQNEGTLCIFSVNEEIKQTIQILSYKIRQAKIAVTFTEENEYELYGDPIKFGQIISNLLANAIEACEENYENLSKYKFPTINIDLNLNDNNLIMIINDCGVGIPPENIERIFEPFFSTKIQQGRGMGIGLASTKNIIEKDFKGKIELESEVNRGTKFIIKFPYEKD